jgi:hypothetical protein
LDAEATRDGILQVSGTLAWSRPGPHPFPPIADWHWTQHNPFRAAYPTRHRSVYLMTQRLHRHPFLALFDGPDPNTTTDVRSSSTVPLQALFLMNGDFLRDSARAFSERLGREAGAPAARVRRAYELAYSRPAEPGEVERGCAYVVDYMNLAMRNGLQRPRAESEAWLSLARTILCSNEFVYVD